ncbi:glycosyltransferase family 4 protein [Corynebacterium pacaense]|uniref:glycosyltransferase family 4 protein n=1 Tax=Corynebacterium pacaense TaxID=1816684 RepID=UPI0009BAB581|nr:glycosyltransferase family 4 protein [Corynebacterium pacaense]
MAPTPHTLVVTNDFPPTIGGIQSYVRDFLATQDPETITVFASVQDARAAREFDREQSYEVIRWPRSVMLPTPTTVTAIQEIIRARGITTVWFAAAAPLALMAGPARRAGARRIIASTHGHEVGWSMLPGARQALRRIGDNVDVITYISDYTLGRLRPALGGNPEFVHLPSGVDTELFAPATPRERADIRTRHDLDQQAPVIVCVSRLVPRKGQDSLIRAMPRVLEEHPDAVLLLVGEGRYDGRLRTMSAQLGASVRMPGRVPRAEMVSLLSAADIFAMPVRTRGGGLDVEGLGIVYLEAQACGIPVVAGTSGGAPETVTSDTAVVVDGRDVDTLSAVLNRLIDAPDLRHSMGAAGRRYVEQEWTWAVMGDRLRKLLA